MTKQGNDVNAVAYKKATDVITDPNTGEAVCRDPAYADYRLCTHQCF